MVRVRGFALKFACMVALPVSATVVLAVVALPSVAFPVPAVTVQLENW